MPAIPAQSELEEMLYEAFRQYRQVPPPASPLEELQLFKEAGMAGRDRQTINQFLNSVVEQLGMKYTESAVILSRRFFDSEKMRTIANSLNISEATGYRRQNEAIQRAATTLRQQELAIRQAYQARLEARLERPTYSQLIGFDHHVAALIDLLNRPSPPWLIAIEGYGGIGKTSLAHRVARQAIQQQSFNDFGWVSARTVQFEPSGQMVSVTGPALTTPELVSQLLTQLVPDIDPNRYSQEEARQRLRHRLKQERHLLVVDNLETVEDVKTLLPLLSDLANPTKFLLTSRQRLASAADIYHFPLSELNPAETLDLIRHEIAWRNLKPLRAAPAASLAKVYQVVGGNPLAVRLVIGQTHVFTLDAILDDLMAARSQTVDDLYTFIYWHAWHALDEPTQQLLLAMPLVADHGETLDGLAEVSGLEAAVVRRALEQLVNMNLVNSLGDHARRAYTIHNLTRSFLQEQVLKWTG
ncbi:MAG: AAA family ATPase [Anaerolineaceae bacterium]|nr:AAA family ATPase [Anaerolineaceae bacterium]MCB9099645.1 AAA family ATPase [Anaerolineales bacterium]